MYKMNKVRELKIDSTLWATPARIINLLDFNPEKLTIDKELNSIHNTPGASSKDLINMHQVRYENGGFYGGNLFCHSGFFQVIILSS